jgi:hypothetical protein
MDGVSYAGGDDCVFIQFVGGGGLMESIIGICEFQDLYFGVGIGCEHGFDIWRDAYYA